MSVCSKMTFTFDKPIKEISIEITSGIVSIQTKPALITHAVTTLAPELMILEIVSNLKAKTNDVEVMAYIENDASINLKETLLDVAVQLGMSTSRRTKKKDIIRSICKTLERNRINRTIQKKAPGELQID